MAATALEYPGLPDLASSMVIAAKVHFGTACFINQDPPVHLVQRLGDAHAITNRLVICVPKSRTGPTGSLLAETAR